MAHHVEPMDIDTDFDNKENSLHYNNVLPFTEKGYEELDVSELNMKLRYSVTPAASPMSKSCTTNMMENRSLESGDDCLNNTVNENSNLTRSLNSTLTNNDYNLRALKGLPLKTISTDQLVDSNRSISLLRPLESIVPLDNGKVTVIVSSPDDINGNSSIPSSSSSSVHTPEATTPTKDIPTKDGGSPIMRGLKSVLNIFRSSQSPIPLAEQEKSAIKPGINIPVSEQSPQETPIQTVLVSTPIAEHRRKEMSPTKRSSPLRESTVVFNEDLETELQWKDDSTIIFSQERIPVHKLMFKMNNDTMDIPKTNTADLDSTVEYMDISYDSIKDTTVTNIQTDNKQADNTFTAESDSEFVDCETTFTKNGSHLIEDVDKTPVDDTTHELDLTQEINNKNDSGSRLRQIILETTQDILDATLSVQPEDLLPEKVDELNIIIPAVNEITVQDYKESLMLQCNEPVLALTFDPTILDKTQLHGDNTNVGDNINVTITNENILDVTLTEGALPVTEDLNIMTGNESVLLDEHIDPEVNSINEHIKVTESNNLPKDDELPVLSLSDLEITKASMPELPVNIPLPDEDDIDIELVMSGDVNIKMSLAPADLPHGMISEEKLTSTAIEVNNTLANEENEMLSENIVSESTVSGVINAPTICEFPKVVNDTKIPGLNINEEAIKPDDFNDNTETEITRYQETSKTIDTQIENTILNIIDDETARTTSVGPIDALANILCQDVHEYKLLPDIINQTISVTNADTTESADEISVDHSLDVTAAPVSIDIKTQIHNSDLTTSDINEELNNSDKYIYKTSGNNTSVDNVAITEMIPDLLESEVNIATNQCLLAIKNENHPVTVDDKLLECTKAKVFEEYTVSENSSPFISVKSPSKPEDIEFKNVVLTLSTEGKDNVNEGYKTQDIEEEIENSNPVPLVKRTVENENKIELTPPQSPPITSRGYSFNFDDENFDPFATNTTIRMSPPFESPNKPIEVKIQSKSVGKPTPKKLFKRQTQSDKKRNTASKRKSDMSLIKNVSDNAPNTITTPFEVNSTDPISLNPDHVIIEDKKEIITIPISENVTNETFQKDSENVIGDEMEQISFTETKEFEIEYNVHKSIEPSSSAQSAYCTASESSIPTKSVFNLPEIDDMNFNPFATRSMMRESPPQSPSVDNPFSTCNVSENPENSAVPGFQREEDKVLKDKICNEVIEKDTSNTTDSSKATDEINETIREVNTEDEDTIEGPFLEGNDLDLDGKISPTDRESLDMIQFDELPTHTSEENLDNGEIFIDAEAFEFLLNQNKTNSVIDSGKESLFLKFDPLFAKRISSITPDAVVASLTKLQNKQSTPIKDIPSLSKNMSVAGPSNLNVTQDMDISHSEDPDDTNITITKPTMAVPPAVNPITPRNKSLTPNRLNRRSITFTSPAMAVIDRLLSVSNNSMLLDTNVPQVHREHNEADIALMQLRELLAEKEINVCNLRSESRDLRDRLNTLESHVKSLEAEGQDRLKKINQLNETLAEKTKINRSMAAVVEEYERTIASLIAETAQDKKNHAEERIRLINERDEQTAHLASMEVSFSDLHSKYEKSKQIILNCKTNEEKYKKSIKEFEENFTKMQNNYELLKQHATSKLNRANQEMEKINRTHEAEVLKLNAMIKRKELHITSLEESLNQKTKANKELTAICDELINKVG